MGRVGCQQLFSLDGDVKMATFWTRGQTRVLHIPSGPAGAVDDVELVSAWQHRFLFFLGEHQLVGHQQRQSTCVQCPIFVQNLKHRQHKFLIGGDCHRPRNKEAQASNQPINVCFPNPNFRHHAGLPDPLRSIPAFPVPVAPREHRPFLHC